MQQRERARGCISRARGYDLWGFSELAGNASSYMSALPAQLPEPENSAGITHAEEYIYI